MITVKKQIEQKIKKVASLLWSDVIDKVTLETERPKEKRFGDYSSNIAMQLAPILGQEPVAIGNKILDKIVWPKAIEKAIVVAPGFLNFYLSPAWLNREATLLAKNKFYKRLDLGRGKKIQVEFISANPTGPLHLGNGRGAFTGDALANVLKEAGFAVQREYYLNDMGKQVDILGESVRSRFFQLQGIKIEYPEYCYKGDYIIDLAKKLKSINSYKLKNVEKVKTRIRDTALKIMLDSIKKMLESKLSIRFDKWFSEASLYESGLPEKVMYLLKEKGLLYKNEGAIFLKTTLFGDDKDRVLVKKDEEPTYFLSDIAYHYHKFGLRKFDKAIDIWGADHYGHQGRMQAAMRALGFEGRLDIIIYQLVRLIKDGKEIKMSKRGGTFVTLQELIEEVGADAARFFFLMYSPGTHLDFDLTLAKEKSEKNPVYYVQYAHARIASILGNAAKLSRKKSQILPGKLEKKEELDLFKEIIKYPEIIEEVAATYEVNKLPLYAYNLAARFHDFYTACRVIDEDKLQAKRYELIKLTKFALMKVLDMMGISAPERM